VTAVLPLTLILLSGKKQSYAGVAASAVAGARARARVAQRRGREALRPRAVAKLGMRVPKLPYQSTNTFFTHMICHPFEQMAAVLDLIGGGVLDRFPRLRVGFFESGLGWLPYWLHRLDEHFEVMGHLAPQLRRRPTEIFREQCFVSMEAEEKRGLETLVELGLVGSVLWGSDYPHYDAKYPGAYAAAEATFIAVGPDVRDQIVDRNPRRFFGLAPF
jgi:predicted TIM-barrel fold metal-dependent hydrolase